MEAAVVESAVKAIYSGMEESELETGAEVKFDLEEDFQRKIAALYCRDNKFARRTHGLIKPEYFENSMQGILFSIFSEYYENFKEIPTDMATVKVVLQDGFKKKRIRKEIIGSVVDEYKALRGVKLSGSKFAVEKISHFARHQALQNFIGEAMDLLEKQDHEKIMQGFEQIKRIGTSEAVMELDYWADIERRTEVRKERATGVLTPKGITTGVKDLDRHLYHKGWGRKELSVIMGGAKRGKSMGLGHFAVNASKAGYNALYLTLEVSGEIIAERMDANVSDTSMNELDDKLIDVKKRVEVEGLKEKRGVLNIVEFPSGSLSPNGVRRILERHRAEGIVYDIIVMDYADIMRPDHMTNDPIENSKSIWLGLRAIASEENAAVLTATQTNRTGYKSEVARAEDVAEDFNKVRIADVFISINRTDEERDKGEARLFFAAQRNGHGEFTLKIKQKLENMQFIKEVVDVI